MIQTVDYFSLLLGFSSSVAQILVMRSLVAALYGNEFVFVLVLVGWLVGIASGSLVFGRLRRNALAGDRAAVGLLILAGALLPLTILAARFIRSIMGVSPGMLMDILPAAGTAFSIVLPLSFVYGALFPMLAGWRSPGTAAGEVTRVYALESLGFVAGGILMTFLLLPFWGALQIALILLCVHVFVAGKVSSRPWSTTAIAGLLCAVLFANGFVRWLDLKSQAVQWQGYKLLENRETIYGNLQLVQKGNAKSLFENGLHVATTDDAMSSEENIHYALLAHPAPRRLLLIGGGLAGGLNEALKHPGLSVDYVELDPAAIDVVRRNVPEAGRTMSNPRVRVIIADGRRFIKQAGPLYDVIIVNLSDPLTLLVNRYYTVEFFREASRRLSSNGILALSVTSSENYLNKEGKFFLRTLRTTLGEVFAEVRSIPGDRHIFLASPTRGSVSIEPTVLSGRLKERNISTQFVREYYFNFRLEPARVSAVERDLLGAAPVNSDTQPVAFLEALVFWSTNFRSSFSALADTFREKGWLLVILPVAVAVVAALGHRRRLIASACVVGVAGFCLMIFQLAVIMAFQSNYGFVYAGIGLITAAFMAGAWAGATWAGRKAPPAVRGNLQNAVVFAAAFAFVIGIFLPMIPRLGGDALVLICLAMFSLMAGSLGGVQFVLATKYVAGDVHSVGILYAVDVIGASIGALLGGIFLIPLWGVSVTGGFCGLLQLAALAALTNW